MARVSLDEAYDDRSVISQIVRLKKRNAAQDARMDRADEAAQRFADKTDGEIARIDAKDSEQDETIAALDELVRTYDSRIQEAQDDAAAADANAAAAQEVADHAESVAEDADAKADTARSAADAAQDTADSALAKIADAYIASEMDYDSQSVALRLEREEGSDTLAMPVASSSQAGIVNSSDYDGWRQYGARIDALEAKGGTVYATIPDGATSDEISDIYRTATGMDPEPGVYISDIERQVTYEYDGSGWVEIAGYEASPFGQGTAGLIVGSESDGQIYAESDGTGSVVGWDAVKSGIDDAQAAADAAKDAADDAYDKAAGAWDLAESKASAFTSVEVSISWDGVEGTAEVSGMTADAYVWVSPAPASWDAWTSAGVRCVAQVADALQFVADSEPGECTAVVVWSVRSCR